LKQDSLFDAQPRAVTYAIKANIDGGARGNPGPAAYGVVIRNGKGEIIDEIAEYLGIQTNNFAEYSGLLAALEYAVREKHASLKVFSDSELLVKQMKGQYRVKNPGLLELYDKARALVRRLERFSIDHVLREYNREADRLVNKVLDTRMRGMRP
jgi:ribonuclease HI